MKTLGRAEFPKVLPFASRQQSMEIPQADFCAIHALRPDRPAHIRLHIYKFSANVRRILRFRVRLNDRASTTADVLTDCASETALDCASATFRVRAATDIRRLTKCQ